MSEEVVPVEVVMVQIPCGKESKEVADVLAELVMDIKAGKKLEALTENLSGLMTAVDGYEQLGPEQKDESRHGTRAYLAMKISEALEYKAPEVALEAPVE